MLILERVPATSLALQLRGPQKSRFWGCLSARKYPPFPTGHSGTPGISVPSTGLVLAAFPASISRVSATCLVFASGLANIPCLYILHFTLYTRKISLKSNFICNLQKIFVPLQTNYYFYLNEISWKNS